MTVRTCKDCGADLPVRQSFCDACRRIHNTARCRRWRALGGAVNKAKPCRDCGAPMVNPPGNQKRCKACARDIHLERALKTYHERFRSKATPKTCKYCDATFGPEYDERNHYLSHALCPDCRSIRDVEPSYVREPLPPAGTPRCSECRGYAGSEWGTIPYLLPDGRCPHCHNWAARMRLRDEQKSTRLAERKRLEDVREKTSRGRGDAREASAA